MRNKKQESGVPTVGTKTNKLLCLCLIVVLMLTQTACWDRVEVEQLALVLATALDQGEDGKVRVTVQVINPKGLSGGGGGGMGGGGGGGGPEPYRNITNHGKTIFDAVRAMGSTVPRQLYFSHNQVIIISEELARNGVEDLMDFFDRNPQIRRSNWLVISKKEVDQYKLLDAPNPLETAPAQRIVKIIQEQERGPVFAALQLGDFLEMMADKGINAYTAGVSLATNPVAKAKKESSPDDKNGSGDKDINVSGTALFNKGRLVGWLNERESRGLLWVREGLNGGIYNVNADGNDNSVALEIINGSSNMEAAVNDEGNIIININIETQANVAEARTFIDFSKPETLVQMQKLLEDKIKQDIRMALKKAQQEYATDVFGFGGAVYRKYPDYWKQVSNDWLSIYPNVEVVINVKADIPRTGLVSEPIKMNAE